MITTKFQAMNNKKHLLLGSFLMIMLTALQVNSHVIGFDFGTTFFKITLVKPG
jgi:uncharacterized membrane protein